MIFSLRFLRVYLRDSRATSFLRHSSIGFRHFLNIRAIRGCLRYARIRVYSCPSVVKNKSSFRRTHSAYSPHGTRKDHLLPELFLLRIYHRPRIRAVLFRRDASVLEHRRILGDALLQNRRERIRQINFAVLHPVAHRARIFLSRASFGSALDGTEEVIAESNQGLPKAPESWASGSARVSRAGFGVAPKRPFIAQFSVPHPE
jgi:hypothetical protein